MTLTDEQLAKILANAFDVSKASTELMVTYNKICPDKHINEITLLVRAIELTYQLLGINGTRIVLTSALFATYNMGRKDEAESEESALDTFKKGLDE